MFEKIKNLKSLFAAFMASVAFAGGACAQDYPTKSITIVVPYVAGTLIDVFTRTVADQLGTVLKQPIVVENRPGAYQVVASNHVARAKPDGYTLMASVMPNVIPQSLQKNSGFIHNVDFEPIGYVGALDMMLAVPPNSPASNLNEFVAMVKASPGKYVFGSAGLGAPHHMMLEMLNRQAGLNAVNVPYASFQNIILDVSSGQLNYSFLPSSVMQFVAQGKMKVLATTAIKRDSAYPDIKTLEEQGIKGLSGLIKFFIVAPKGTPREILNKLNSAINFVIATDTYAKRVQPVGGVTIPPPMMVEEVTRQFVVEDKRFDQLVKDAGIKLN
jgi:tripartite-type tricarboxylate transporter receptor subunit TctC